MWFLTFFSMPEDLRKFCLEDYLGEVRQATSHIQLSLEEKGRIEGNTIGTVMKLLYAFLWQEEVLVSSTILLDPFINQVSCNQKRLQAQKQKWKNVFRRQISIIIISITLGISLNNPIGL